MRLAFLRQLHPRVTHGVRVNRVVVESLRQHGARLADRLALVTVGDEQGYEFGGVVDGQMVDATSAQLRRDFEDPRDGRPVHVRRLLLDVDARLAPALESHGKRRHRLPLRLERPEHGDTPGGQFASDQVTAHTSLARGREAAAVQPGCLASAEAVDNAPAHGPRRQHGAANPGASHQAVTFPASVT
jgi:hypothetical protein